MKTQTGKPVTIICFVCVSSNIHCLDRLKRLRFFFCRKRICGDSGICVASFCQILSINENISRCCILLLKQPKAAKAQSEQQNRRKFLFILFVIIFFLHYEYLRFFYLFFALALFTFYLQKVSVFKQKPVEQEEKVVNLCRCFFN